MIVEMNLQDREAIERLFSRMAEAEAQAGPRDAEADAYIRQQIARQPGAPYMMAQTIVMQTYALEQAQERIETLEQELAERCASQRAAWAAFPPQDSQWARRPECQCLRPKPEAAGSLPAPPRRLWRLPAA
jgi:hypothetical protein